MGIKGFSKWLRSRYPTAFNIVPHASFDALYVDGNSLLHRLARTSRTEAQLQSQSRRHLRHLLRRHPPRTSLMVALDGPASLSKLPEQRRRRLDAAISAQRTGLFDTQQFTPGCHFMTRYEDTLQETIKKWFDERKPVQRSTNSGHRHPASLDVIISGAATEGEGELKIFDQLRRNHQKATFLGRSLKHGIITGDSDALLQAIAHGIPHTFVITPPWDSLTAMAGISDEKTINPIMTLPSSATNSPQAMNADLIRQCLVAEASTATTPSSRSATQIITDFALLVLLAGGDYLPALGWGSYTRLWPLYCRSPDAHLVDLTSGQLNLDVFQMLLRQLQQSPELVTSQGLQRALLQRAQQDLEGSQHRMASYLASLQSLLSQVTGHEYQGKQHHDGSLSPGNANTNSNSLETPFYSQSEAPSLGEFTELMDPMHLKQEISRLVPLLTLELRTIPLPGAAAILMLSLPSQFSSSSSSHYSSPNTSALNYLPTPLHQLAHQYCQAQSGGLLPNDHLATNWLNQHLHLAKETHTPEDLRVIYNRPATTVNLYDVPTSRPSNNQNNRIR